MKENELAEIPVSLIDPSPEPVRELTFSKLADMKDSIKKYGVLQPILVRPKPGGRYEIVFGHHRFYAAKGIGLATLPAKVRELSDRECQILALEENIQREDMDAWQEGRAFKNLLRQGFFSIEVLSERIGKSKAYISGRIRIYTNLNPDLKAELGKSLTVTNAANLCKYSHEMQVVVFQRLQTGKQTLGLEREEHPHYWGYGSVVIDALYCVCEKCGSKHLKGVGKGTVTIKLGEPVKLPWLPPSIVKRLVDHGARYCPEQKHFVFSKAEQTECLVKIGLPIEILG